jgi:hypothetical protein
VRLPKDISPAARARRALLVDVLIALAITATVLLISAGVGVVGFGAAISLLLLGLWFAAEKLLRLLAGPPRAGRPLRR